MKVKKRIAIGSFLITAVLFSAGIKLGTDTGKEKTENISVIDFTEKLSAEMSKDDRSSYFEKMTFSKTDNTVCIDGKENDDASGIFCADDGEIMVDASLFGCGKEGLITISEAQDEVGLEVVETENGIEVSSPFQTSTVIVKAQKLSDTFGAESVVEGYNSLHVLRYSSPSEAYKAYNEFIKDETIEFAEPDRVSFLCEAEMPEWESIETWGTEAVRSNDFLNILDSRPAPEKDVVVAVIDSGLYKDHELFKGRIAEGGKTFSTLSLNREYGDYFGHGTHCAGIICSVTNENVKILPIKVMDDKRGSGTSLEIYCGMMYAAEQNVDVVNMSLGVPGRSPLIEEAARVLAEKDIPLVAAAGNENNNCRYSSPANIDSSFTIASVDYTLEKSSFSNYGKGIDFAAPGSNILNASLSAPDGYVYLSGTSMAAPYASGCIADILCMDDYSVSEIYDILKEGAVDLGEPGFDEYYGNGLIQFGSFKGKNEKKISAPQADKEDPCLEEVSHIALSTETEDALIYYTTDGSIPDEKNGTLYTGEKITVDRTMKLKARAFKENGFSCVSEWDYILSVPEPKISVQSGSFEKEFSLELEVSENTETYYTTDGSEPSRENGMLYDGKPIKINETTVLRAVSFIGKENSRIFEEVYRFGDEGEDKFLYIEDGVLRRCYINEVSVDLNKYLNGREITEIGIDSFSGCDKIEHLTVPETVSKIGDRAFLSCCALSKIDINWSKLAEIGESAFAYTKFSDCGEIALTSAEKIGKGAFLGISGVDSVILSDKLTELPESIFRESSVLRVKADGLVSVGARALPANEDFVLEADLGRIVSVGEEAFENYDFGDAVSFDSLTDMKKDSFKNAFAGAMYFPAAKIFSTEVLGGCSVDAVYLENAEKVFVNNDEEPVYVEDEFVGTKITDALENCKTMVIGDKVKFISLAAAGREKSVTVWAGAINSPVKEFADNNGYEFVQTPSVYVPQTKISAKQEQDAKITAYPLGFGYETRWTRYDASVGEMVEYDNKNSISAQADTSEKGRSYYAFELMKDGETVYSSERITVDTEELPSVLDIIFAEPLEDEAVIEKNGQYFFSFFPKKDGKYTFYTDITEERKEALIIEGTSDVPLEEVNIAVFDEEGDIKYSGNAIENAELEAGEKYYINVSCSGLTENIRLYSVKDKKNIKNASVNYSDIDFVTGEPIDFAPELTDSEGRVLEEGKDYTVDTWNNILPGRAVVMIRGINDYTGTIFRTFDISIDLKKYMFGRINAGEEGIAEDLVTIVGFVGECGKYTIDFEHKEGNDIFFKVYDIDNFTLKADKEICVLTEENNEFTISPKAIGDMGYVIIAVQEKPESRRVVLNHTEPLKIYDMISQKKMMTYTGEFKAPEFLVSCQDEELKENVDYTVTFNDNGISAGIHTATITGIGNFRDFPVIVSYFILPDEDRTKFKEVSSIQKTDITEGGMTANYVWRPAKDSYCLRKTCNEAVMITVYDEDMNIVKCIAGNDYWTEEIKTEPGKVYYIAAAFLSGEETGSFEFELLSDYCDISECIDESVIGMASIGDDISKLEREMFVLKDGETVLEYGKDYITKSIGDTSVIGTRYQLIVGLGKYTGSLKLKFYVCATAEELETFEYEHMEVQANTPVMIGGGNDGDVTVFEFTAPQDDTYSLMFTELGNLSVFAYGTDGELIDPETESLELKKGDTVRFAVVGDVLYDFGQGSTNTAMMFISCENLVSDGMVLGDADGNGVVNAKDIKTLKEYILNGSDVSAVPNGDVNGDGKIDAADIMSLVNIFLAC